MIRNPFAACMAYDLEDDNANDSYIPNLFLKFKNQFLKVKNFEEHF